MQVAQILKSEKQILAWRFYSVYSAIKNECPWMFGAERLCWRFRHILRFPSVEMYFVFKTSSPNYFTGFSDTTTAGFDYMLFPNSDLLIFASARKDSSFPLSCLLRMTGCSNLLFTTVASNFNYCSVNRTHSITALQSFRVFLKLLDPSEKAVATAARSRSLLNRSLKSSLFGCSNENSSIFSSSSFGTSDEVLIKRLDLTNMELQRVTVLDLFLATAADVTVQLKFSFKALTSNLAPCPLRLGDFSEWPPRPLSLSGGCDTQQKLLWPYAQWLVRAGISSSDCNHATVEFFARLQNVLHVWVVLVSIRKVLRFFWLEMRGVVISKIGMIWASTKYAHTYVANPVPAVSFEGTG